MSDHLLQASRYQAQEFDDGNGRKASKRRKPVRS